MYPTITFKREQPTETWYKSQWGAYYRGVYLGSVYSLYTGGWAVLDGGRGYNTRYEAAYRIYQDAGGAAAFR